MTTKTHNACRGNTQHDFVQSAWSKIKKQLIQIHV